MVNLLPDSMVTLVVVACNRGMHGLAFLDGDRASVTHTCGFLPPISEN
jgi:hypothetical protein